VNDAGTVLGCVGEGGGTVDPDWFTIKSGDELGVEVMGVSYVTRILVACTVGLESLSRPLEAGDCDSSISEI